jgi:hypothetical protein
VIETSVVQSIADIPRAEWERVCTGDPLWQHVPFATYERAGFGADGMCYLVLREGGEILSVVPLFWFGKYPLDAGGGSALDRLAAAVRKLLPRFFTVRILFAGSPIGTGWPLVYGGAETGAAILRGIRGVARDLDLPLIILKDLDPALARSRFSGDGAFFSLPSLPDTHLEIRWKTFDAYLASLRPAARRNVRSKLRKFAASGLRLEVLNDFGVHAAQLEALYANVVGRAKAKLDRLDARFFEEAAAWPDTQVVACFDGGRMIGFLLVAEHDGEAVAARVGLDYAAAVEGRVYFALQYEAVRLAIERGVRTLAFCQTAYVFKREMGCTLVPLVYVATHRNAVVRSVVRRVLPAVMNHYRRACGLANHGNRVILPEKDN